MNPTEWYEYQKWPMLNPEWRLRMGRWDLGYIAYDWTTTAPRGCRYMALVALPGIPTLQGHHSNETRAKAAVEKAVKWWFYHLESHEEEKIVRRISRTRTHVEPVRIRRSRVEPVVRVRRGRLT